MSGKYDSVLKEKKKYEDYVDDRHFLRRHLLLFDFLAIVVIMAISFVIYFNTILTPKRIVYDDLVEIFDTVDVIYERALIDYNFDSKYNFSGIVDVNLDSNYDNKAELEFLNELSFNYAIMEEENRRFLDIDGEDYSFQYYENDNKGYLNFGDTSVLYNLEEPIYNFNDYENISINSFSFLESKFNDILFKRSVYVDEGKAIVSVDFDLTGSEINQTYKNLIDKLEDEGRVLPDAIKVDKIVSDSASFQFTIKNDLFKNNIIDVKVVINDGDYRGVFNYQDNSFGYRDDDHNYKCVLKIEEQDFSLRFYEEDIMKYILAGKGSDSSYSYTYHVIDVIDNFTLQIVQNKNENKYTLNIKKENDDKYMNLIIDWNLKYNNFVTINNEDFINKKSVLYDELGKEKKEEVDNYIYRLYNSISNLFKFVK